MSFHPVKKEKGDVFGMKWKDIAEGEYKGPGLPSSTIEKFQVNKLQWEYLNILVEKNTP